MPNLLLSGFHHGRLWFAFSPFVLLRAFRRTWLFWAAQPSPTTGTQTHLVPCQAASCLSGPCLLHRQDLREHTHMVTEQAAIQDHGLPGNLKGQQARDWNRDFCCLNKACYNQHALSQSLHQKQNWPDPNTHYAKCNITILLIVQIKVNNIASLAMIHLKIWYTVRAVCWNPIRFLSCNFTTIKSLPIHHAD